MKIRHKDLVFSHRGVKRSLTLIETLIALVLVVAMGALIFPSLMNSLDERTFESAADVTNEQLVLARAHAQATGAPVEVMYSPARSQVQSRWFVPTLRGLHDRATSSSKSAAPSVHGFAGESAIDENWAHRDLGRGVRLAARTSARAAEKNVEFIEDEDAETFENFGKGQDVRLAIFMPDGSALLNDDVWLNDESGRIGVFTISQWSGLPFFKRLADLSAKAAKTADQSAVDEPPDDEKHNDEDSQQR